MLKYVTTLFVVSSFYVNVAAQIIAPAMSPFAKVYQKIGLAEVEVEYSRPSLRGRMIFGENGVIAGDGYWRTGANSATKFSVNQDVILGGELLPKGTYAILSKPSDTGIELSFHIYESGNWQYYVDKDPSIEIRTQSEQSNNHMETFMISFQEVTLGTALLRLEWGNFSWSIPIDVRIQDRMLTIIDREMNGPSMNDYYQAALFLHEAGIDLERALEYIQKVTNRDNALFFQVHREALILADLDRKEEAKRAAERSRQLSVEARNKDFIRLNEMLMERLGE